MRVIISQFIILLLSTLISCHNPNDIDPEWTESADIPPEELHAKTGDFISFKDSTGNYFVGVILNFNKSEGGIWYAMCFANYYDTILPDGKALDTLKMNGSKVRYFGLKQYLIGLVATWARDTLIDSHSARFLGNRDVHLSEHLGLVGQGSVTTYSSFINSFDFHRKERLFPGIYGKDLLDSTFHPELSLTVPEIKAAEQHNGILKRNR